MAIIQCSNCGHIVSDQARACPKCGTLVSEMMVQQQEDTEDLEVATDFESEQEESSSSHMSVSNIIIIILVVLYLVYFVIRCMATK